MRSIESELEVREGATDSHKERKKTRPGLDVVPLEKRTSKTQETQVIVAIHSHYQSGNKAGSL